MLCQRWLSMNVYFYYQLLRPNVLTIINRRNKATRGHQEAQRADEFFFSRARLSQNTRPSSIFRISSIEKPFVDGLVLINK